MQLQKVFTKLAMKLPAFVMLALFGLLSARAAQAAELTFSYDDPIGDHSGTTDVKKMTVVFDNTTGDYKIVLRASAAHPFAGKFRVNLFLFNPDTAPATSVLEDVLNDYNLAVATTTLTLYGTDADLTTWEAGHHVATTSLAGYGTPPGINLFFSGVYNFPLMNPLKADIIAQGPAGAATVAAYTPQDAIKLLAGNVETLMDAGTLTANQAGNLITLLNQATAALNQGQNANACAFLQAFVNQVNDLKNQGVLSLSRAKPLVVAAADIRADLGC